MKEIISDHKADYTKDDLLALYTFTGGVPKYIEQFMDNGCTSMESMVDFMLQPDSSFLTEGQALLIQEFGKNTVITFLSYQQSPMVRTPCRKWKRLWVE